MSDSTPTEPNIEPAIAAAVGGEGAEPAASSETNAAVSAEAPAATGAVGAVDRSTSDVPTDASAVAASGVSPPTGAAEASSGNSVLVQRLLGIQRVTEIKEKHHQWEGNVANMQLSFAAVMKHPVVEALAEKADALAGQLQTLSGLVQQVQPLVTQMGAVITEDPVAAQPEPLFQKAASLPQTVVLDAAVEPQQQSMVASPQKANDSKKYARRSDYDQIKITSDTALKKCAGDAPSVDLKMAKEAAQLRVLVQLKRRKNRFNPKKFEEEGYYIVKDFVPKDMQPLLLHEADDLLLVETCETHGTQFEMPGTPTVARLRYQQLKVAKSCANSISYHY